MYPGHWATISPDKAAAIDTGTGERQPLLTRVRYEWPSAGGEWLLSWDGSAYHTLNIRTGAEHDVTADRRNRE